MKKVLIVALLFAVVAWSQTLTNQGRPGTQGPWPVKVTAGGSADGGAVIVQDSPCFNPVESTIICDGGAAFACPVTQAPNRRSVLFCSSERNTGTPIFTIYVGDGGTPSNAISSPGQTLSVGKCITYNLKNTSSAPQCICDAANTALNITECQ